MYMFTGPDVSEVVGNIVSTLRESVALMDIIRKQHFDAGRSILTLQREKVVQESMRLAADQISGAFHSGNDFNGAGYQTTDDFIKMRMSEIADSMRREVLRSIYVVKDNKDAVLNLDQVLRDIIGYKRDVLSMIEDLKMAIDPISYYHFKGNQHPLETVPEVVSPGAATEGLEKIQDDNSEQIETASLASGKSKVKQQMQILGKRYREKAMSAIRTQGARAFQESTMKEITDMLDLGLTLKPDSNPSDIPELPKIDRLSEFPRFDQIESHQLKLTVPALKGLTTKQSLEVRKAEVTVKGEKQMTMQVKVEELHPEAITPMCATITDLPGEAAKIEELMINYASDNLSETTLQALPSPGLSFVDVPLVLDTGSVMQDTQTMNKRFAFVCQDPGTPPPESAPTETIAASSKYSSPGAGAFAFPFSSDKPLPRPPLTKGGPQVEPDRLPSYYMGKYTNASVSPVSEVNSLLTSFSKMSPISEMSMIPNALKFDKELPPSPVSDDEDSGQSNHSRSSSRASDDTVSTAPTSADSSPKIPASSKMGSPNLRTLRNSRSTPHLRSPSRSPKVSTTLSPKMPNAAGFTTRVNKMDLISSAGNYPPKPPKTFTSPRNAPTPPSHNPKPFLSPQLGSSAPRPATSGGPKPFYSPPPKFPSTLAPPRLPNSPTPSAAPWTPGHGSILQPSRHNNYHGFCKGAWSIRTDPKAGISLSSKALGLYSKRLKWKCKYCPFTGESLGFDRALDPRVNEDEDTGIKYKWMFLAKSHCKNKAAAADSNAEGMGCFGCLFCAEAGKETAIFGSVGALMGHIKDDHSVLRWDIALRNRVVLGDETATSDAWDIQIPFGKATQV